MNVKWKVQTVVRRNNSSYILEPTLTRYNTQVIRFKFILCNTRSPITEIYLLQEGIMVLIITSTPTMITKRNVNTIEIWADNKSIIIASNFAFHSKCKGGIINTILLKAKSKCIPKHSSIFLHSFIFWIFTLLTCFMLCISYSIICVIMVVSRLFMQMAE